MVFCMLNNLVGKKALNIWWQEGGWWWEMKIWVSSSQRGEREGCRFGSPFPVFPSPFSLLLSFWNRIRETRPPCHLLEGYHFMRRKILSSSPYPNGGISTSKECAARPSCLWWPISPLWRIVWRQPLWGFGPALTQRPERLSSLLIMLNSWKWD